MRNKRYDQAIADSSFGSISRLAEHLGLSYRDVESYADGYGQRKKKTPRKKEGAAPKKAPPRRKAEKIRKREADMAEIRRYFESGLLPTRIFIDADDAPEGLTPRAVSLWLSPKPPKIPAKHLAYVLKRCRAIAGGR